MVDSKKPEHWASLLKKSWEQRSAARTRDFFVASMDGWDDPEVWERQAESDTRAILIGYPPEAASKLELLEIGCGVGRLALKLAPRLKGYTGFDISGGMVEEARRRCAALPNARFFESGGLGVPEGALDRPYDLAIAVAVFIHCPRPVIAGMLRSTMDALAPGGEFRFQVLADEGDPTGLGIVPDPQFEVSEETALKQPKVAIPQDAWSLIEGHYYMGDVFTFDGLHEFIEETLPKATGFQVFRPTLFHHWARVVKKA
jgi:SAM-dependent methyltransferase